ncbi:cobalt-zinc-cadmium resistance protein CzcC precursor [mine drainage metagenome]|uniref:Cobalt-zinc-cadmium resistance protein CzcC n=1 Tax=mine drainage metagenome TaxID=410659 RepID=A0A1J5TJT8_9ZZZZ
MKQSVYVLQSKSHDMKLRLLSCITVCIVTFYCGAVLAEDVNLGQLNLSTADELFRSNNRELLAAKRMVESAQAGALIAGQKPNPILSLGLSNLNLNRNQGNANPGGGNSLTDKTLNSTIQINQLFERGDKRELRIASAEDAIKASKYDLKDTIRQQRLALANAYYDLMLAQESERIQTTNVSLYEKTLQAAELRLDAGDIAFSDVARIRVDVLRVKNDLRQSMANHQKAQANLAYLIGKEKESNSIVATDTWPSIRQSPNATDQGNTSSVSFDSKLNQRADILAAEARMQQAEQNRRLANSLKTRDIDIGVQYQHFPGQGPAVGDNTLGAFVSIPLFSNYQYQGEISRSEVDFTSALEAKEQIRAAAIGDMTRAQADLNSSIEKVRRFDEQMLGEAQKAADAAEFAYQHGAIGVTDLLDSRRILRALQLDAASAHADYAKSLAAWQAATNTEENP